MANLEVANTIWYQISIATKMACGARRPRGAEQGLTFQVGNGRRHLWVSVTLEPSDTYTVKLTQIVPNGALKELEVHEDIYAEDLSEVVYHAVNK
jgi:hypothetical protein